jgi:hypothetical protein
VFWTFLLMLAIVFSLIAAHEKGHFLAGMVVGIPARDMRIVVLAYPQHVALRNGDRWVSHIKTAAALHLLALFRCVEITYRLSGHAK